MVSSCLVSEGRCGSSDLRLPFGVVTSFTSGSMKGNTVTKRNIYFVLDIQPESALRTGRFSHLAESALTLASTGLYSWMEELYFLASPGNLPLNVCSLLT